MMMMMMIIKNENEKKELKEDSIWYQKNAKDFLLSEW